VLIDTIFTAIGKIIQDPDERAKWPATAKHQLAILYPTFLQFNLILGGGLFVIGMFKDHFDGMRNLLKFAGMGSVSYKLGLLLAEYCVYLFMSVLLVLCGFILSSDVFGRHWYDYAVVVFAFGVPFVPMNNIFSYPLAWFLSGDPQKATEKGFMYAILPTLLLYGGCTAGFYLAPASAAWAIYLVPFTCLQSAINKIVSTPDSETGTQLGNVYGEILAMLAQGVVYFGFCVLLDHRRLTAYKGQDGREEYTEREQLPENDDVAQHRNKTY
jgi:hypothetical protein